MKDCRDHPGTGPTPNLIDNLAQLDASDLQRLARAVSRLRHARPPARLTTHLPGVRLTPAELANLQAHAQLDGRTVSDLVRRRLGALLEPPAAT